MKKSLLLIPSMMAVTTMPFICLTSCTVGGGEKPEPTPPTPPEPEEYYKVTQQQMESAIKMEGVECLQSYVNSYEPEEYIPPYHTYIQEFSPTAYDYYEEQRWSPEQSSAENWYHHYFIKHNEEYIVYSANSSSEWEQEVCEEDDFETPQTCGDWLYNQFYLPIGYTNFIFNEENKCYEDRQSRADLSVSHYFENKKLVKINYHFESPYIATAEETFTYVQKTPPLPFPSDIVLNDVNTDQSFTELCTHFWYYDLEAKKYNFTIDMDSWSYWKPTNPDSYTFLIGVKAPVAGLVEFNEIFSFIAYKDGVPTQLNGNLAEDKKSIIFNSESDIATINEANTITCEVTIDNVIENDDYFIFYAEN